MVRSNGRKRILIIDDCAGLRRSLTRFMEAGGFDVEAHADGESGLEGIVKFKPDLVILDLRLPGMAGWEVLKEIREDPETENLPVILLTAVRDDESRVLGLRSGADDYVVKPFHALELLARVERMLDIREQMSERARAARPMEKVPVRSGDRVMLVPRENILFMEAAGKYTYVHTPEGKFLSDCSLKEIEEAMVCDEDFFRVHRSYLVNLKKVAGVTKEAPGRYMVDVGAADGARIYVSQRRLADFKELLHLHF